MIVFGLGLWAYPRSIGFTEVSFSTQVTDIIDSQKNIANFKQTLFSVSTNEYRRKHLYETLNLQIDKFLEINLCINHNKLYFSYMI